MLKKDKRGLSEIVGYVIIVVIAISISFGVYAFMKSYLPKFTEECPQELTIGVKDYLCDPTADTIELKILNNGNFNADGFLIRGSDKSEGIAVYPLEEVISGIEGIMTFEPVLKPGEEKEAVFSYNNVPTQKIVQIEIQPFKVVPKERDPQVCKDAVVKMKIEGCD
ncbi:MAG: archaellin/type IV pilin N-terminal domain-containing protein [Nanoarchaeota archaeon]